MTMTTETASVSYTGDGTTVAFAYPFEILQNADIEVSVRSTSGAESTKILTTHYSVSGAGNPGGGTVTFVTAPGDSERIVIRRNMGLTQPADFDRDTQFPSERVEEAFDRKSLQITQMQEQVGRAVKARVLDEPVDMTLPAKASRATKAMGFDATGKPKVSASTLDEIDALVLASGTGLEVPSLAEVLASGSTTARTLGDRFADRLHVKDFGAVGDGAADDTAAIQAALDHGGPLDFSNGTYLVDGTLHVDGAADIQGHGSAVLMPTADFDPASGYWIDIQSDDVTIQGVTFLGYMGLEQSDGAFALVYVETNGSGELTNPTVVYGGSGYSGSFTYDVPAVSGQGSGGQVTCTVSAGAVVSASIAAAGSGYPVSQLFSNNDHIHLDPAYPYRGLYSERVDANTGLKRIKILNNRFVGCRNVMWFGLLDDSLIEGNNLSYINNDGYGIVCSSPDVLKIRGNTVDTTQSSYINNDAIRLSRLNDERLTSDVIITDNTVRNFFKGAGIASNNENIQNLVIDGNTINRPLSTDEGSLINVKTTGSDTIDGDIDQMVTRSIVVSNNTITSAAGEGEGAFSAISFQNGDDGTQVIAGVCSGNTIIRLARLQAAGANNRGILVHNADGLRIENNFIWGVDDAISYAGVVRNIDVNDNTMFCAQPITHSPSADYYNVNYKNNTILGTAQAFNIDKLQTGVIQGNVCDTGIGGPLVAITINSGGTGYADSFAVYANGGGWGAMIVCEITSGVITDASVARGGFEYLGGGSGSFTMPVDNENSSAGSLTCTVTSGRISAVAVNVGGTGYMGGGSGDLVAETGEGAELTATASSGVISGVTVNNGGRNYLGSTVSLDFSAGGGSGVSLTSVTESDPASMQLAGLYDVKVFDNTIRTRGRGIYVTGTAKRTKIHHNNIYSLFADGIDIVDDDIEVFENDIRVPDSERGVLNSDGTWSNAKSWRNCRGARSTAPSSIAGGRGEYFANDNIGIGDPAEWHITTEGNSGAAVWTPALVVGAQGAAISDASGGGTVDSEARAAINALLAVARAQGNIAT